MPGVDVVRARRWFWLLVLVAVLATGAVYWALDAPPGPMAAIVLFFGGIVAATSTLQAARVLHALNGPPRFKPARRLGAGIRRVRRGG